MTVEKPSWFIAERSEALAGLLLTDHDDVKIHRSTSHEAGIDIWAEVQSGESPTAKMFVVRVTGTLSADDSDWSALVRRTPADERLFLPSCLFVMNVRDNGGRYAWLSEPKIVQQQAKLQFNANVTLQVLNAAAIDEIVNCVNAWYETFPAQLATAPA